MANGEAFDVAAEFAGHQPGGFEHGRHRVVTSVGIRRVFMRGPRGATPPPSHEVMVGGTGGILNPSLTAPQ